MTIHSEHPFVGGARDQIRVFRGRLASGVTLWTSNGSRPAGLTVSSVMVANGEPARLLALLDPLSDLAEALADSGKAAVTILDAGQRRLAEVFAGLEPSPGGPFRVATFTETEWGPVPAEASMWAGVRLEATETVGWSLLVTCVLAELSAGAEAEPLVHYRGRYPRLA